MADLKKVAGRIHRESGVSVKTEDKPLAPPVVGRGMVIVEVTKAFTLRLDDNTTHSFKVGVQEVKRAIADHWYAKANGMKIFEHKAHQHHDEDED